MKWLSENDVAYRVLMEDVSIWILMSGCVDFSGTLNDFVITEVQLNLKPSNSRTHIEPNRTQNWEYKNRTQIFTLVKNSNQTITFVRTWTEPNPSSEGSFPSLVFVFSLLTAMCEHKQWW